QERGLTHGGVRDLPRAVENLEAISRAISPKLVGATVNLLPESLDPDGALNLLERLCRGASPATLRLLERRPFLVHYALVLFGYSPFLGDTLIRNPDLLHALAEKGRLDRGYSADDYRRGLHQWRAGDADPSLRLAGFKRREYIHILLRDVLGIA